MSYRSVSRYVSPWNVAVALLLCFLTAGWAQAPSTLSGTVKDPTGGVVVRAIVALTDTRTSQKTQTLTNDEGAYFFSDLAPGNYTMEVSADGFAAFQQPVAVAAQPQKLDIGLSLAQASGAMSVEAKVDPFNVVPVQPTQT